MQFSRSELGKIYSNEHLKEELQKLRREFRDRCKVKIIDVTDNSLI